MKSRSDFDSYENYTAYLRAYFAAMAMQAILSNPSNNSMDLMGVNTAGPLGFITAPFAVKEAIQYADELLKQLEQ